MRYAAFAIAAYFVALGALPYRVTHSLGAGCYWRPVQSYDRFGLSRGEPSFDDRIRQERCFQKRGQVAHDVTIYRMLKHWPSHKEIRRMRALYDARLSAQELPPP